MKTKEMKAGEVAEREKWNTIFLISRTERTKSGMRRGRQVRPEGGAPLREKKGTAAV